MRETQLVSEESGGAVKGLRGSEIDFIYVKRIFEEILSGDANVSEIQDTFRDTIKNKSKYQTELSTNECFWILNNLSWIPRILKPKREEEIPLSSIILWCLYNKEMEDERKEAKGIKPIRGLYIQEMGRRCYCHTTPIKNWIKKYHNDIGLVKRRSSLDYSIRYILNRKESGMIIGILLYIMKNQYGEKRLDKMVTPAKNEDGSYIDLQGNSVKGESSKKLVFQRKFQ